MFLPFVGVQRTSRRTQRSYDVDTGSTTKSKSQAIAQELDALSGAMVIVAAETEPRAREIAPSKCPEAEGRAASELDRVRREETTDAWRFW
jgi:hypothetical protein